MEEIGVRYIKWIFKLKFKNNYTVNKDFVWDLKTHDFKSISQINFKYVIRIFTEVKILQDINFFI